MRRKPRETDTPTFEPGVLSPTVAVGTIIADRPPHRSVRARLRIRLLPRMNGVEALVGIGMQDVRVRNPPVEQWVEAVPAHLRALTATDQNAPPQSAYATPEDAQLTGVTGHSMVLVITLHDLPKPCAALTRMMMFPVLKLGLHDGELRNHPLLRGDSPDIESSTAREISAKMRESQKREGLGLSLATLLPVSDGEPPELDQTRLLRM